MSDYIIFIGRFQPYHNAHHQIIMNAFKKAQKVIIIIGSYKCYLSIKNPWNYLERKNIILDNIPLELHNRIIITGVRDFMYNINGWISSVQNQVKQITNSNHIQVIGHVKDNTSDYLKWFPQWEFIEEPNYNLINATDIRNIYFNNFNRFQQNWSQYISESTYNYLIKFYKTNRYDELKKEYDFIKKYKDSWKTTPYAPVFVTTDNVVIQSGHVLFIQRKGYPGKKLYALPGGFVNQNEKIQDGAIRELIEETQIKISKEELCNRIAGSKVFDHPMRDLRGRTITHAFFIKLKDQHILPEVKGSDDALSARWISFQEMYEMEDQIYSDHIHIVNHFVRTV
jgi:bifunctional NMN adenylyltransferase/nudix hydrolase